METNTVQPVNYFQDNINPVVQSPFVPFNISLYHTKDTFMDTDEYINFIKNSVSRFRRSRFYKNYKSYLMSLGMYRSQFSSNISSDMATIEMHHNILTIFDIAVILTEHELNRVGMITSFDLVNLMKKVHRENKVQVVMLTLTEHQKFHLKDGMFIHPDMCFGNWIEFINEYGDGITIQIANKIINYITTAEKYGKSFDNNAIKLRENLIDWSRYNGNTNG